MAKRAFSHPKIAVDYFEYVGLKRCKDELNELRIHHAKLAAKLNETTKRASGLNLHGAGHLQSQTERGQQNEIILQQLNEPSPPSASQPTVLRDFSGNLLDKHLILRSVPKKYKEKVESLLNELSSQKSKTIEIDSAGNIMLNGLTTDIYLNDVTPFLYEKIDEPEEYSKVLSELKTLCKHKHSLLDTGISATQEGHGAAHDEKKKHKKNKKKKAKKSRKNPWYYIKDFVN